MTNQPKIDLLWKMSRVFELCNKMFKEEFKYFYTARKEEFRDWINQKTGCHEDHMIDKDKACDEWMEKLELIYKHKFRK